MVKALQDAEEAYPIIRVSPPQSSSPSRCQSSSHDCRWQPYANARDFEANAAMIVIILFCAIISGLALNAAIRCFLRGRRSSRQPPGVSEVQQEMDSMADANKLVVAPPTLVFSSGMKLAGAEAECAICLSEFVEGEEIRVMGQCKHGFHVHCIQKWLSLHSSCPTCRGSCLPTSAPLSTKTTGNEPLEV